MKAFFCVVSLSPGRFGVPWRLLAVDTDGVRHVPGRVSPVVPEGVELRKGGNEEVSKEWVSAAVTVPVPVPVAVPVTLDLDVTVTFVLVIDADAAHGGG